MKVKPSFHRVELEAVWGSSYKVCVLLQSVAQRLLLDFLAIRTPGSLRVVVLTLWRYYGALTLSITCLRITHSAVPMLALAHTPSHLT